MNKTNNIKILLKKNPLGLTITDLVSKSKLPRSTVRNNLARLEGSKSVLIKKIGMAKVYTLRKNKK